MTNEIVPERHKYIPTQLHKNSPCAWADHPDAIGDARYYCGLPPSAAVHLSDAVAGDRFIPFVGKDVSVIHDLFYEFHYADDLGVIKSKLTEYVATVRAEERSSAYSAVVNNIAAVLDADDVEVFTALIMKAMQSPDLNSEMRSALKSEAEIRKEEREAAFSDFTAIVKQYIGACPGDAQLQLYAALKTATERD